MSEMQIESGLRPERNFTVIANQLITDKSISADAFRIMAYLLSKPASWRANERDISRQIGLVDHPKKRSYVYQRAIRELKSAGYLEIKKGGDKTKREFSTWILREPKNIDASEIQSSKNIDASKYRCPKNSITEKLGHHSKTLGFNKIVYLTKTEKKHAGGQINNDSDQNQDQDQNQSAKGKFKITTSRDGNDIERYNGTPIFSMSPNQLYQACQELGINSVGKSSEELAESLRTKAWSQK